MRTRAALALLVLAATSLSAAEAPATAARRLAKEAYQTFVDHPYEADLLTKAGTQLDRAMRLAPKEAWVFLASSAQVRTAGYKYDTWHEARNFQPGTLEKSAELARKATEVDPKLAEAHVQLARVYIPLGQVAQAQRELGIAHQLEPEAFSVWFEQAVLSWKDADGPKARKALEGARARAKTNAQLLAINGLLERMAKGRDDDREIERIKKENIALLPGSPWGYANYGAFLLDRGRYDEAVAQYEKALSLGKYPLAEDQLAKARALRDAKKR
jgi:tetratricopeptide (TPR) repeat protein